MMNKVKPIRQRDSRGTMIMDTLSVSLPGDMREFVDGVVAAGDFSDPSEYLTRLVELDQAHRAKLALEKEVIKGIQSGEPVPMTAEDWRQLRAEVEV
jgi:antitoxin ParD1/3/4